MNWPYTILKNLTRYHEKFCPAYPAIIILKTTDQKIGHSHHYIINQNNFQLDLIFKSEKLDHPEYNTDK